MPTQSFADLLYGRGVGFLGCGRMGFALLSGMLEGGTALEAVTVIDPAPGGHIRALETGGLGLNAPPPVPPALTVLAVKPQAFDAAVPSLAPLLGPETLVLSVMAGVSLHGLGMRLGAERATVRAMPNTPAAIGAGTAALVANAACRPADRWLAEACLATVGEAHWIEDEGAMDAVTGVSGSGPAYVFYLIEALAAAGVAEGLPEDLALDLARATVAGAGQLAADGATPPSELREAVTSPGGTTAAALRILMDGERGLAPLIRQSVAAAAARSRELGQ